ncbi:MAG TPA: AAA family ATPase [Clostridia bacterium]|nr:AAA family ATPase [Clostridia bacterium]
MRIIAVHIYGYGKLTDRTFNFKEGFNLVLGKNESGKSTLMSFIKAMLYGHKKNEREKDGFIPEVKKYKPWNSDKYGGYLILETDEKKILRVERDFNGKTLSVYNEYGEEITNEFSFSKENEMIGQDLLGMDYECFINSSFMCQDKSLLYAEDKEHIAQKLMNIKESGEEQISVGKAVKKLKEGITLLGNERTKGRKYNILSAQIREEEIKLTNMQKENKKCMEYLAEAEEIKKELEELENEEKLCKKSETFNRVNENIEEYERYNSEIEQLKKKLSDTDIDAYEKRRKEFDTVAEQYKDAEKIYERLSEKEKRNNAKRTAFAILAILIIATGAVLAITTDILLLLCASAAIPFIVLFLIMRKKNKELIIQAEKLENMIKTKNELAQIEIVLGNDKSFNELIKRYTGLQEDILRKEDVLDYSALLEKADFHNPQGKEPKWNYEECLTLIREKRERLAVVKAQIKEYMNSDEQIASQEERIFLLKEQMKAVEEKQKALQYAIDGIEETSKQIREEIIPKMNRKMSEYLKMITAGNHDNLSTGSTMDLNTEHNKTIRSVYNFSDGTLRQMYLAFRLAAAKVFSSECVTPVFMDETLVYYDEERKRSTFDFLYELSRHNQILFFATDMENSLLEGKDIAVIQLSK